MTTTLHGQPPRLSVGLTSDTPGRLRLGAAVLLALGVVTGLLFAFGAHSASAGVNAVGRSHEPLLVSAELVYTSLADADATAASAFLSGGLEPADDTTRYQQDLDTAGAQISKAAQFAGTSRDEAKALTSLGALMHQYAELVGAARANNRQGFPVGAAYLSQASDLNRTQMLPAADRLFDLAQRDVHSGYGQARSNTLRDLSVAAVVALLIALLLVQLYLTKVTRRTINVPLALATGTALLLAIAGIALSTHSHHRLSTAEDSGSGPLSVLAKAQIATLQLRDDESRTLVARGDDAGTNEADFKKVLATLSSNGGLLQQGTSVGHGDAQGAQLAAVAGALAAYTQAHVQIRALDDAGNYTAAVSQALAPTTRGDLAGVTQGLSGVISADQKTFSDQIDSAGNGLGTFTFIAPLLAIVVCALALLGLRARLEEYR